jgi:hypothetical protein
MSVWQGTPLRSGAVMPLRMDAVTETSREPLARCGEGCVAAMETN